MGGPVGHSRVTTHSGVDPEADDPCLVDVYTGRGPLLGPHEWTRRTGVVVGRTTEGLRPTRNSQTDFGRNE